MAKKQILLPLGIMIAVALAPACNSNNQPANQEQPAATGSASSGNAASSGTPELRHRSSESATAERSSTPAAPATVTLPAGTTIAVRLADAISSASAQPGAAFQATLAAPLVVHGQEVAPTGASVTGTIVSAVSSGRLSRPAELSLTLTSITPPGGGAVPISTNTWAEKGGSHKKRNAELIGGGAGVGALIGALAGHGKGAAIGAAVGAGAGTAGAAYTGKKEIELPAETRLDFKLTSPVTLTVTK